MSVLWHDLECGGYEGDLALWRELAAATGGPVLDLDPDLVAAFNARARATGLPAEAAAGDARAFSLGERFAAVLAPMQLLQVLDGPAERVACLRCAAGHLLPAGRVAVAIVDGLPAEAVEDGPPPLPDAREVDGWLYSSLPLDAPVDSGSIVVRRLRQTVSPAGELSDELDETPLRLLGAEAVESEARQAGLRPVGRREVPPTDTHVGSAVLLLEAR